MSVRGGVVGLYKPRTVFRRGSLPKLNYYEQEEKWHKFWSLCDNIIIECA